MRIGLGLGIFFPYTRALAPEAFANSPAPAGFRWGFVTANGKKVTSGSEPVVALEKE